MRRFWTESVQVGERRDDELERACHVPVTCLLASLSLQGQQGNRSFRRPIQRYNLHFKKCMRA